MRKITHLNFDWQYKNNFEEKYLEEGYKAEDFERVNIPHANVETPYNNFDEKCYQIKSCYKKTFNIKKQKDAGKVYLHFDGVMAYAKVYVNNKEVGEHYGGYTPFKFDITEVVNYDKENIIMVMVDSSEELNIPPFGFVIDYLTYGGIYREVRIEQVNDISVENAHIKTLNVLSDRKTIDIDLFIDNNLNEKKNVQVECILKDKTEVLTYKKDIEIDNKTGEKYNITFEVKDDINLWDVENPNLYYMEIRLVENDKVLDAKEYRFGFREVKFTENGFYLNGKKLKIRGLNRHQSFPYVGYAMPKSAQYKDAEILKYELGVNTVRLSHYPQSNHFMDRCDELGLLVFDEIPGWQHIGKEGLWWDTALQHVDEMIKKDWNHPSVFAWGVRINESGDQDKLYALTNDAARALDTTRPTTGVRCIGGSNLLEDVYSYNDFIHNGKRPPLNKRKNIAKEKVPYLITEHNGHMFPTKSIDFTGRRTEQAMRHARVLNAMYLDDEIAGAIGWCMFDYNTHKDFGSGDKICYHGVMDMFRSPKFAASTYSSQQDKLPVMDVIHSMENGDLDESIRGDVVVMTNCDYIKVYVNEDYIGDFYPDKKNFAGMPHPPIVIDDFVGDKIFKNERFNRKDAQKIKNLLLKSAKEGVDLPLLDKMKMGIQMVKYKMDMNEAIRLFSTYIGGWGTESITYKFEGFIDDKKVIEKTKSKAFSPKLVVLPDSTTLTEDVTYDTTRIMVKLINEDGDTLSYANDAFKIVTDGCIELIGPDQVSLIGGSIGFWVKTAGKSGKASVTISNPRWGEHKVELDVNKN